MNQKIIQIEPETLEDYKEIVKDRYGYLDNINQTEINLLQEYKSEVGDLKGTAYDEVLETMWEKR